MYFDTDFTIEAEALYERALKERTEQLGEHHTETLNALCNLTCCLHDSDSARCTSSVDLAFDGARALHAEDPEAALLQVEDFLGDFRTFGLDDAAARSERFLKEPSSVRT